MLFQVWLSLDCITAIFRDDKLTPNNDFCRLFAKMNLCVHLVVNRSSGCFVFHLRLWSSAHVSSDAT